MLLGIVWLVGGMELAFGYAMSVAVVARSWAEFVVCLFERLVWQYWALTISTQFPFPWVGEDYTCYPLAMFIMTLCTAILVTGVKESTRFCHVGRVDNRDSTGRQNDDIPFWKGLWLVNFRICGA